MQYTITVDSSEETSTLMKKLNTYTINEITTILWIGIESFEKIKERHIENQWNKKEDASHKRKKQSVEDLFASLLHKRDEVLFNESKKENDYIHELQETIKTLEIQYMKLQDQMKHQEILSNILLQQKITENSLNNQILFTEKLNDILVTTREKETSTLLENQHMELLDMKNNISKIEKNITMNKSNQRGIDGENFFHQIASYTFSSCSHFEIIEKKKENHCGDFWLKFEKYTIMVDSKNYIDNPVPSRDRQKLKNDIFHNQDIKIAWLVSMDQPIMTFSNYPFMLDIENDVCYCYINSLMKYEKPEELLRMAWYACDFVFHNIINVQTDTSILHKYEQNEHRIKKMLNKLFIQSRNRFAILNQLNENFKETESDIRDCLNEEIRNVTNENILLVKQWWDENIISCPNSQLKSNDIYKIFIQCIEYKHCAIDNDLFKQIIRSMSIEETYVKRGKTDKSQIIILHHKIKNK
jgi:hypothetical protein